MKVDFKMRTLVTGGLGYIGSHTCVALLESGFDVGLWDNLSNSDKMVLAFEIRQQTGHMAEAYRQVIANRGVER